jgi:hypothetical protein
VQIAFKRIFLERLHNHSFINILFYLLFDSHQTHLRSCAGPCAGAWLLNHPINLFFRLLLNVFFTVVRTKLGFSHLLVLEVLHYICSQPLDPIGIHLFRCAHGGERTTLHNVVQDTFMIVATDVRFHVSGEQTHVLLPPDLQSSHC